MEEKNPRGCEWTGRKGRGEVLSDVWTGKATGRSGPERAGAGGGEHEHALLGVAWLDTARQPMAPALPCTARHTATRKHFPVASHAMGCLYFAN